MNNTISKKDFVSNVECFLGGDKFESIYDLKIPADKSSVLIYNTDDLWLSKAQFDVLMRIISAQKVLYVAQNDSEEVYQLDLPTTYEEYYSLNLFSLSFIASEKFDWVIAIDEGLESGTGVLIGNADFVKEYASQYRLKETICGSNSFEVIKSEYDFSESIISGIRWNEDCTSLRVKLYYAWDEPAGCKDRDVTLVFENCSEFYINIKNAINSKLENNSAVTWSEVEKIEYTQLDNELDVSIKTNFGDCIEIVCQTLFLTDD